MKFSAQLDVSVVAHETDDEVALMLDLEAPMASETENRIGTSLQVVLDRSGSMQGAPLAGALRALAGLVARLDGRDNFGVVVFDHEAQVVVPAGPLIDKQAVLQRLATIEARGSTDLSSGYLRGLQEIKRVQGDSGGTLLIVSDGHVNAGLTDAARFADLARTAQRERIVTSTLGYGLGYDESLLSAIARGGSGNHHFAQDADTAGALIASEVDNLLAKTVQAASLTVELSPAVQVLGLYNDLPVTELGAGGLMIELGDFYAEETRKLLMRLKVPAMAALGLAQVATMELRYVELPALLERVVTIPVTVNVVPGDEAAGRVQDPTVRTEVLFQEAQRSKRLASEALRDGDERRASTRLAQARASIRAARAAAPESLRADLEQETAEIDAVESSMLTGDLNLSSKVAYESYHRRNRKRGRGYPGPESQ